MCGVGFKFYGAGGMQRLGRGALSQHEEPSAVPETSHLGGPCMPKLTQARREWCQVRVSDGEVGVMIIMWAPVKARCSPEKEV